MASLALGVVPPTPEEGDGEAVFFDALDAPEGRM